jgi:hypothetical protein
MNQEVFKNLNRSITTNEVETVIKKLQTKKSPGPDEFAAEFFPIFKEEQITMLLKLFHKVQKEGILPNTFCEVSKDTSKKENYRPISLMKSLSINDMILYLKDRKISTKKLIDLINTFIKIARFKINTKHKNQYHFYIQTMNSLRKKSGRQYHSQ